MSAPFKFRFGELLDTPVDLTINSPLNACLSLSDFGSDFGSNSASETDSQTNAIDLSVKGDGTGEKRFYCPTEGCVFSKGMGKSFKKKMLVDQHFLNCHSERKFKCGTCGKSYAIEWQLRYHAKTCGIDWICMTCNKCYRERLSLITHCKRHNHALPTNAKMIKKQSKDQNGSTSSSPIGQLNGSTTQLDSNNNHSLSPDSQMLTNNLLKVNLQASNETFLANSLSLQQHLFQLAQSAAAKFSGSSFGGSDNGDALDEPDESLNNNNCSMANLNLAMAENKHFNFQM